MATKNKKEAEHDIPDKSHATTRTVVEAGGGEIPVPDAVEEQPTYKLPIRPEQTPRKREDAEEADSDQARGDDLAPADYDNPIVRGEVADPLDNGKKK